MNALRWRILAGGLLILAGLIALFNTFTGIDLGGYIWSILFILGGLAFIYVMATDKSNWWASFPGFSMLGIGAGIGVAELWPRAADILTPGLILGGIGVSFLVVYLLNRSFWWAIRHVSSLSRRTLTALTFVPPTANSSPRRVHTAVCR